MFTSQTFKNTSLLKLKQQIIQYFSPFRLRRRRQREPEVIEESEEEEEIPKRKIHQPIQLEEESDDEDLNEQV